MAGKYQSLLLLTICILSDVVHGWQRASLNLHNKYRNCHGVPAMTLTQTLNHSAQRCANYLASIKRMDHVCNGQFKTGYGENLASGSGGGLGRDATTAGIKSTEMWYREEPKHNYNGQFQYGSGHFTQVIWRNSRHLGMGYAKNGDFTVVVAHYSPAGNFGGQFKQNVPRPRRKC